jgi:hypothetical protein
MTQASGVAVDSTLAPPSAAAVGAGSAFDPSALPTRLLLASYQAILAELRDRGVVRTSNAPAGDFAEYLVVRFLNGVLPANSEKSWDVLAADGRRVQVKCRVVRDPKNKGQRQLSPFRSFDFDDVIIVLLSEDYAVWRAVSLPADVIRRHATYRSHVNGHVAFAVDQLLTAPETSDITQALRAVAENL